MIKNKKLDYKNIAIVSTVALAIGLGVWFGFVRDNDTSRVNQPDTSDKANADKQTNKTNDNEPDEHKKSLPSSNQNEPSSSSSNQKTVKPIITNWSANTNGAEVSSYVPNIAEDGGTCTLTLAKGSQRFTASREGVEDVNKTSCGSIELHRQLAPGTWQATISYSSPQAKGVSSPVDINVE